VTARGEAESVFDPRLYLVTDPAFDYEPLLPALFDAGVTMIQVRDKRASDDDLARRVERVLRRAAPYGVTVVVNDRVEVARTAGAHGVHLGQSDRSPAEARRELGPRAIVGLSLERTDHSTSNEVSYAAVSPVYATPTKTDTAPALGLDGVRSLRRTVKGPLVGIGGIDVHRAGDVVRAGADGVAVISAILGASSPVDAAREMRDAVDEVLRSRSYPRANDPNGV
jgi:thiamine-phosphate pyrophosphorylase